MVCLHWMGEKKAKDIVMSAFRYMTLSRRSIPKIVIVVISGTEVGTG